MPTLTESQLRRIIREEILTEMPTTPSREYTPTSSPQERNARWKRLSRKFPKLTAKISKQIFDAEAARYEDSGSWSGEGWGGTDDENALLLDLLEKHIVI